VSTPYASEAFIHRLLGKALAAGASDVHLAPGQPPGARVRGDIVYFRGEKIVPDDTVAIARVIVGPGARILDELHDRVFAYEAKDLGRFRVTLFRRRGAIALVMRSIPLKVPTFAELGVPAAATAMVEQARGLIVVSGGAGEGKSSTAAAMIAHVNDSYARHVVTLEAPIEHVFEDHRGSVSQREVGDDTPTFSTGLRASLRQDPDVVYVSDLPDRKAFRAALAAAELGPLVIACVPAPDATRAIGRLFELGQGLPEIGPRIAAALQGVLAQRLLPRRDGSGVVLSSEVLVATAAVREALRAHGPAANLRALMEKEASPWGMQTFEMHEKQLAAQGLAAGSMRPPPPA
jgi:twitching motility protein PilT